MPKIAYSCSTGQQQHHHPKSLELKDSKTTHFSEWIKFEIILFSFSAARILTPPSVASELVQMWPNCSQHLQNKSLLLKHNTTKNCVKAMGKFSVYFIIIIHQNNIVIEIHYFSLWFCKFFLLHTLKGANRWQWL